MFSFTFHTSSAKRMCFLAEYMNQMYACFVITLEIFAAAEDEPEEGRRRRYCGDGQTAAG